MRVEHLVRMRDQQSSAHPQIRAEGAHDGEPGVLRQDSAEAAWRGADDGDGLVAEGDAGAARATGKPVDGILEDAGMELLYSGVTSSSPSAAMIFSFSV